MKKLFNNILKVCLVLLIAVLTLSLTSCKNVSEITGISYNSETGKITWDKAQGVETYNLTVNGVKKLFSKNETEYVLSENELMSENDEVEIEIEGLNEKEKVVAETDTAIVILPNVSIEIKDGYFDWTASTNEYEKYKEEGRTVKYKVVFDGQELSSLVTESKYKITSGSHEIRVKPVFENTTLFYSNYASCESKLLETPSNLNFDVNRLLWNDVDFFTTVATYKVLIDDKEYTTHNAYIDLTTVFKDIEEVKEFKATVQAISAEDGITSSDVSEEFTFKRLDQVTNVRVTDGTLYWDDVEGADCYEIELDGTVLTSKVNIAKYQLTSNASYVIRVRACANTSYSSGKWSQQITTNTLAKPSLKAKNTNIVWNQDTNAAFYRIKITKVDNEGKVIEEIKVGENNIYYSNIINVDDYCIDAGIYKVAVAACPSANNTEYCDSVYSDEYEVVRLGLPIDYKITESSPQNPSGEVTITLTGAAQGAKYICKLNDVEIGATNSNTFTFSKPLITYKASVGQGYTSAILTIQAKALSSTESNKKIYLDAKEVLSLELRQLDAPDNLKYESQNGADYVVWDANEKAQGYGILFNSFSKSSNGTKFAIPSLDAGNFTVSVYAKGDILKDFTAKEGVRDDNYDAVSAVDNYSYDYVYKEGQVLYLTSTYSSSIMIKKLGLVSNIKVDSVYGTGYMLNWDYVQDALGYMVVFNTTAGQRYIYKSNETNENGIVGLNYITIDENFNEYDKISSSGVYVEVYACGNTRGTIEAGQTIIIDSDASSLGNGTIYEFLKAPTLSTSGINIAWTEVTNASGYTIMNNACNWIYAETTGTTYEWTDANDIEAGAYKLSVIAKGDFKNYFNSCESNVIEFTKLATPTLENFIEVDNKSYFIKVQEGCTIFQIETVGSNNVQLETVNLKVIATGEGANVVNIGGVDYVKYTPSFNKAVNPTIKVRALGDGVNYMASNVYTLQQITRTMDAPINPNITAFYNETENKLHITADVENPFGLGYSFYFNSTKNANVVETPEIDYTLGAAANLKLQVGFEGYVFVAEGDGYIYYYDSSANEVPVVINFLGTPRITNVAPLKGGSAFTIKWAAVTNGQYRYCYKIFNGETLVEASEQFDGGTLTIATVNIDTKYANTGYKIVFYVYAVGNDEKTGGGTNISSVTPGSSYSYFN